MNELDKYKLNVMWHEDKPLDGIQFIYGDSEKQQYPTMVFHPREYNKYKDEFKDLYLFEGKLYSKERLEMEFKVRVFNEIA